MGMKGIDNGAIAIGIGFSQLESGAVNTSEVKFIVFTKGNSVDGIDSSTRSLDCFGNRSIGIKSSNKNIGLSGAFKFWIPEERDYNFTRTIISSTNIVLLCACIKGATTAGRI